MPGTLRSYPGTDPAVKKRLLQGGFYDYTMGDNDQRRLGITSSTVTKSFLSFKYYYIFKDGHLMEIQPGKKAILKVLTGHDEGIKNYLKNNHINFDSDTDLQTFFTWYNSLS